jgi:hypothetical protein
VGATEDGWVLHIVDADGANLMNVGKVGDSRAEFGPLRWTSDGNALTYVSFGLDAEGKRLPYEIWIVSADGTDPGPLAEAVEVIDQRYYPWYRLRGPDDIW